MLELPGRLTPERFLARHWQKAALFMPQAAAPLRPTITRNELAWLATLDDVESRIVFTDRRPKGTRYRVEHGPFEEASLSALPKRDWTLLVQDVDKHLPAMRRMFSLVPFVPDWRIDDLMVSFAAPGGGVGPHRDNYDVFLCQGIGARDWRWTDASVAEDPQASDGLMLTEEFDGGSHVTAATGDVLYLPPGIVHWGTATRACMTYSIGMRAPNGYRDPDLDRREARPGYISRAAHARAAETGAELGRVVTETKEWLKPVPPTEDEIRGLIEDPRAIAGLELHGMARLAFDDDHVYLNGCSRALAGGDRDLVARFCERRRLDKTIAGELNRDLLAWMLANGAFAIPEST